MRRLKFTVLNICSGAFLIWIIASTVFNFNELSEGEGWGIVAMMGLFVFGLVLLLIDWLLQTFIKNRKVVNIVGILVTITGFIMLYKDGLFD